MKKGIKITIKFIAFFFGWALCATVPLLPVMNWKNPPVWRFVAELIPLLSILIVSLIFWLIERKRISIAPVGQPVKNLALGVLIGLVWLGITIGILSLMGVITFIGYHRIAYLWLWTISCLLNVIMQELLVRGYLYQLLKKEYTVNRALIVTTALFTLLHGGAFEAGIIPVLNVVTMSIFVTLVLEYYQSIIAPIVIHFVWNYVGAIILGSVSLAADYPSILETAYRGNQLLSGGIYKIEGSIVVLILNSMFILIFAVLQKRDQSSSS